jgi:hypothetical protein
MASWIFSLTCGSGRAFRKGIFFRAALAFWMSFGLPRILMSFVNSTSFDVFYTPKKKREVIWNWITSLVSLVVHDGTVSSQLQRL